ncbi:MAG TPA: prealbumin-like fold domain-containing protein [Nitrososphaeraceae archaeon]|nr:prealbumin-like fold domain-containing protein [Nitrososphaeraceae archaeon]
MLIVIVLPFVTKVGISKQIFSKFIQTSPGKLVDKISVVSNSNINSSRPLATNNYRGALTIVTTSNSGIFLPGAQYSITPNRNVGSANYTIKDDGPADTNKVTSGIITISGLSQGKYIVTQLNAPKGYLVDKLSKIVQINTDKNPATATFIDTATSQPNSSNNINGNSQIKSVTYNAKFECGSIIGDEGPLRPGHYDTDIGIFNKQDYPVKFLWNAIVNEGKKTSPMVKTMQPQTSTGIICKDIRQLLSIGNNSKELVEGFVVIRVDMNAERPGLLSSNESTTNQLSIDGVNILDVQVFYTANALESLPRQIVASKIVFSILNDSSSKIPSSLLMKPIDITLQSQINKISDPESEIKNILSLRYNLTAQEVATLRIKILNVNVGIGSMIDDHAISSYIVAPQMGT